MRSVPFFLKGFRLLAPYITNIVVYESIFHSVRELLKSNLKKLQVRLFRMQFCIHLLKSASSRLGS